MSFNTFNILCSCLYECLKEHNNFKQEYMHLKTNINEIKVLIKNLKDFEAELINNFYKYCSEQKELIQTATDSKIQRLKEITQINNNNEENINEINKSNEEFILEIANYEHKCIRQFLNKNDFIKEELNKQTESINSFLSRIQRRCNDVEQMKIYNNDLLDIKFKLNFKLKILKNLIFNENKIEFTDTIDEFILGYIDYDKCFTVIVIFFNTVLSYTKIRTDLDQD